MTLVEQRARERVASYTVQVPYFGNEDQAPDRALMLAITNRVGRNVIVERIDDMGQVSVIDFDPDAHGTENVTVGNGPVEVVPPGLWVVDTVAITNDLDRLLSCMHAAGMTQVTVNVTDDELSHAFRFAVTASDETEAMEMAYQQISNALAEYSNTGADLLPEIMNPRVTCL